MPAGLMWPRLPSIAAEQRLEWASRGFTFTDQPVVLSRLQLEFRDRLPDLQAAAKTGSADHQALATVLVTALEHRTLEPKDLARISRATVERRTLVAWVLLTQPASEEARLRTSLASVLPDATDSSWAEWVGAK